MGNENEIEGCVYPDCDDGLNCSLSTPPKNCPIDVEFTKVEERRIANYERYLRWAAKHKEEVIEYRKKYYQEHKEQFKQYAKKFRATHVPTPEELAREREQRLANYDPKKQHYHYLLHKRKVGKKMSAQNLKDIEEYEKNHPKGDNLGG